MIYRTLNILIIYSLIHYTSLWAGDDARITGRGPLAVRNQFPLNQNFLSFTADDAFTLPGKQFRLNVSYSHANTFAQSPEVLNNIVRKENRSYFDDQNTVIKQNSEWFLIDNGSSRINLNVEYGVAEQISGQREMPLV